METTYLAVLVLFSVFSQSVYGGSPAFKVCDATAKYEAKVASISTNATVDSKREIELKRGTSVDVSFTFSMLEGSANNLKAIVHGIIDGVPIPFSLPNPTPCKNCGLTCPVKAPGSYQYHTEIPVLSEYPTVRLVVKWELQDENKKELWCVEMPCVIV